MFVQTFCCIWLMLYSFNIWLYYVYVPVIVFCNVVYILGIRSLGIVLLYSWLFTGLQELVVSGNPRITPRAWEKFSVALSAGSTLRSLYLDFNNVGETAGKMLVVCAAGHRSLNVLDMEACELTESVGRVRTHTEHVRRRGWEGGVLPFQLKLELTFISFDSTLIS